MRAAPGCNSRTKVRLRPIPKVKSRSEEKEACVPRKSGLAMAAVVTAYSSLRYWDSRLPFHTNSGTAIPTAKFVGNVFAMKTPSSPIYAQNPDFLGVCASQNDTITFGNCAPPMTTSH
jgi:hypothetical protein